LPAYEGVALAAGMTLSSSAAVSLAEFLIFSDDFRSGFALLPSLLTLYVWSFSVESLFLKA
jgi:hypothetical protein